MIRKKFYLAILFTLFPLFIQGYVISEKLFPRITRFPSPLTAEEVGQKCVPSSSSLSLILNGLDEFNKCMAISQEAKQFLVLKIDSVQAAKTSLPATIFDQVATSFKGQGRFAVLNLFENPENDQLAYDLIAPLYAVQGKLLTSLYTVQLPIFLLFLPDEATGMMCKKIALPEGQLSYDSLREAITFHLSVNESKK